jgi:crotonobetainyl-CoA:carnitine CoA-transferase CaiB-like acyl-CoA transferase
VTPLASSGDGAMFLQCNRNKLSMTLDPQNPRGIEVKRRLVETADVVIVNLPESTLKALGLDYETLKAIKPDIILTNGTAYGLGGPYSERIGYDGIGQVMSGAIYRSGMPGAPMRAAVPYVDFATALSLAIGTLAALLNRTKTGHGQQVEGALLATALMMSNAMLMEQAVLSPNRVAIGNQGYSAAPSDLYRAKDGWLLVQIVGQPQFKRWCGLIGEEDWFSDPRFVNDDLRGTNRTVLNARMAEWCAARKMLEALVELEKARIPASPLYSPQEALDDPHIKAMGYYKYLDYPGLPRKAPIMETPFRMSATPGTVRTRAPTIGEHTDLILSGLGYDNQQIAELRRQGVV